MKKQVSVFGKFVFSAGVVALILLGPGSASVFAETRYISDVLVVSMRTAPNTGAELVRTVLTGTPLEVVEDQGRFIRVRTKEGEVGWILSQYTTTETPKAEVIARYKKETARLKERVAELESSQKKIKLDAKSTSQDARKRIGELEKTVAELRKEASRTASELEETSNSYNALRESSRNVVEISTERDRLQEANERLNTEIEHLLSENTRLSRSGMVKWFLAGGGVLLVGWFAGKRSRKKRLY